MPQVLPPPLVDEWELPKEQFTLEKMLGSGHFADVYSGRWKNHTKVAIKILKNNGELTTRAELKIRMQKLHSKII